MRKVIFRVANSVDNFIAREDGRVDWLLWSEEIGAIMEESWKTIDTVVMGRKTYEAIPDGENAAMPGMKTYVLSRTLAEVPDSSITVVSEDAVDFMGRLKAEPGKDICFMGGGEVARPVLEAGLIDELEINIHPLLLGAGIPLFRGPGGPVDLELAECRALKNGCVLITYRLLN